MIPLRSILDHSRNRIIDQRSLMTCIPTDDLAALMDAAEKYLHQQETGTDQTPRQEDGP